LSGSPPFPRLGKASLRLRTFSEIFIVLKDFLIERFIPGVELLTAKQYAEVAGKSNAALSQLGAGIEWVSSFIVKDMTFCHYRAQDEEIIREHARISGFPANKISLITNVISPKTAAS